MEFMNIQNFELSNILYGALGSALFAFIVYVTPKVISAISVLVSKYSTKEKERRLNILWLKYSGMIHEDNDAPLESASNQVALIYKSLRQVIKAFIWIVLGLIFQDVFGYLGIIGFLGGLYYLFSALGCVQSVGDEVDPYKGLSEVETQLDEIELNKSSKRDAVTGARS